MQGFFEQLMPALSVPRLRAYDDAQVPVVNLDVVSRYIANMELAATLSPLLHIFEVTFRNQVHETLSRVFATPTWYDLPHLLQSTQQNQLASARASLQRAHKLESPPRLIAELMLGFWVALFSRGYEQAIWKLHGTALKSVFPHAPRWARARDEVSQRLQPVRDLRNRVSHWERVNNHVDLGQTLNNLVQLVQWLNPAAAELLKQCDRRTFALSSAGSTRARNQAGACFVFTDIATWR